jgi:hypothetical protein
MDDLEIASAGTPLSLSVGDVCVRFEPAAREIALAVPRPHVPFLVRPQTRADCVVLCEYGVPRTSHGSATFSPGDAWELRELPDGREEIAFFAGRGNERDLWQTLMLDAHTGHATVRRISAYGGEKAFKIGFPTDEHVHSRLLAQRGAVVLHASAVLHGSSAFAFVGHSGAGKSTMAQLATEASATVLSDDRTVLGIGARYPTVWGTPWHGTYRSGSARSGILRGLFLLAHGSEDRIDRLSARDAIGEIFVRVMHPAADQIAMDRCLSTIEEVVSRVPVGRLWFRPTPAAFLTAREWALDASGMSATIES